jgi:eukaryotic translation initiation factor 2C
VQKVRPELVRILNGEFVAKPKERGTLGRPIRLRANHYAIGLSKSFNVYQYNVEIKKKFQDDFKKKEDDDRLIKNKSLMRDMFLILTRKTLPPEYDNKIVYNFSKNLYSLKRLPFDSKIVYEMVIEGKIYLVEIRIINQVLIDFSKTDDPLAIHLLDLIFTMGFNYSCINLNRSFFKETGDNHKLGFGLELWKGAYASVRPSEIGLTWNIDSVNAAFLISENVLEACARHYGSEAPYQDLKTKIEKDKDSKTIGITFLDFYKGREIKTDTGGFRKKIAGFGPDALFTFDLSKGDTKTKISIKDYIFQNYNKQVLYPHLPCIDLGKNSFLPMEFCKTEIKSKKKLSDRETADMIKAAAVKAPDRMNYIQNWANSSLIDKDPILKEYNISINLKLLELEGRVLEAPDVQYGGAPAPSVVTSKVIAERGSWDHRNSKFVNGVSIKKWVVLNFSARTKDSVAYEFAKTLIRIGKLHGMNIADPLDYDEIKANRGQSVNEDVRRLFENMVTKHKGLEFVMAIFSGTTTIYNTIKTCGDIYYGVATQGVEEKNVYKINDQTISNILLKVNTKLGGRNWFLSRQNRLFSTHLQEIYQGPLMILGADVTHPSPSDFKVTESIAAVVGSLDKECSFYAARLFAQKTPKGQAYEMIHSLNEMFSSLLNEYFRINKAYPKRLVFFRDGVSEGQFSLVLRWEMNKIREACQSISTAYKPAITFILVQKRHHTRLFPVDAKDKNGKAENVPPGTVVDKHIVSKSLFDFFLCSHVGIQVNFTNAFGLMKFF